MTTPQQYADSQIRLIKLKAEIAKLEAEERAATITGYVVMGIVLIVLAIFL